MYEQCRRYGTGVFCGGGELSLRAAPAALTDTGAPHASPVNNRVFFYAHTLIQMTLRQGFGDAAKEDGDYR